MNKVKLRQAFFKTSKSLLNMTPILLGVILLISMIEVLVPKEFFWKLFTKNPLIDPFIWASLWSIMAWNPITGYILWKWFLDEWVSLIAVTAFLVCWVTVGLVQLPVEISVLGKKFAISRNISAFFMSVIVAIVTVYIYKHIF